MWQTMLVIVIVTASAAYVLWLLLTARFRARLAGWLAARLPGAAGPLAWLHAWLETKAQPAAPLTGCEACPQSRIDPTPTRKPPPTP